ncbi:hypothetical protein DSECCO2_310790 [anaerobic digester metagenome]
MDVHLDPSDPAALLQVSQVELVAQQPLGLPEYRAHHVRFFDNAVSVKLGLDQILGGAWVNVHHITSVKLEKENGFRTPRSTMPIKTIVLTNLNGFSIRYPAVAGRVMKG